METSCLSQFLPLSTASNYITKWNTNIDIKTDKNIYYKSFDGHGQIEFKNNCKFQGELKSGLFEGKGVFYWPNGVSYEGDFKQSKITGFGKFKWSNGSFYEGQVSNGQRQGQGVFYCTSQNYTYNGSWKEGRKQGIGKIQYKDQSVYEGNFTNDKKNGFGKIIYSSKNQYEGEWKNDKKHGKGTMIWHNVHEKYIGQWKDDLPDGYGEYYWLQNKTEYKILKNVYKGYWKKGKRQGFGSFFFSNGCRFEGYFHQNLKEGSGILIDEQGFAKIQLYANNRVASLTTRNLNNTKQENIRQSNESEGKLPKIAQKKLLIKSEAGQGSQIIKQSVSTHHVGNMVQNWYKKYVDLEHPQINETFYNMLLRHNSELRNLYKIIGTSNSQYRQFYTGMVLSNYWKVLRENKLLSDNVSIVAINREFGKGKRNVFDLKLPDERVIQTLKKEKFNLEEINYEDVLWQSYYNKLIGRGQLDWPIFKLNINQQFSESLGKFEQRLIDIHNPSNIILFRHFVSLIIHTAMLIDQSSKQLKDKVQTLIHSLNHFIDPSTKNQKVADNCTFVSNNKIPQVPQWVKIVHQQLINQMEIQSTKYDGKIDISIPVRKMYSILELGNVFKDVNEKILYLQRIERYLNIKNSSFKKQYKNYYPEMDKNVKTNPAFGYIMNYEMNIKQFNEFLFLCINKKFVANNQEDMQIKYKETVKMLINIIRETKSKASHPKLKVQSKRVQTGKDKAKKQLILDFELAKQRELEQEEKRKQMTREIRERELMAWEDHDAQVIQSQSEASYQYYN